MKVLHLAAYDCRAGGGAFNASYRLHRNMLAAGIESVMAVGTKNSDDSTVVDVRQCMSLMDKVMSWTDYALGRTYLVCQRPSMYFYILSGDRFDAKRLASTLPFVPDAIISHWVSEFVTPVGLRRLQSVTGAPVLWYFMDMAPLTGGCHYANGCMKFAEECGACPQLRSTKRKDLSYRQFRKKSETLRELHSLVAVTASTWSQKQAEISPLFCNRRIERIPIAVATDVFQPGPKNEARQQFGMPCDRKIIFFGAHDVGEERKGMAYLIRALTLLRERLQDSCVTPEHILIVTAGQQQHAERLQFPFERQHIGFLLGDTALAAAYQAADILVSPSLEDAGPMMINEALLCGLPVVAFDVGVALDLVLDEETGYRAALKNSEEMASGMLRILELEYEQYDNMSRRCRRLGLEQCAPEVQVKRFVDLIASLPCDNGAGDTA